MFILQCVTCGPIKLLELSDDSGGKFNVMMANQNNSATQLFVDSAQRE